MKHSLRFFSALFKHFPAKWNISGLVDKKTWTTILLSTFFMGHHGSWFFHLGSTLKTESLLHELLTWKNCMVKYKLLYVLFSNICWKTVGRKYHLDILRSIKRQTLKLTKVKGRLKNLYYKYKFILISWTSWVQPIIARVIKFSG